MADVFARLRFRGIIRDRDERGVASLVGHADVVVASSSTEK